MLKMKAQQNKILAGKEENLFCFFIVPTLGCLRISGLMSLTTTRVGTTILRSYYDRV